MSNQKFKMVLTGPISAMGDIVNCATGHGSTIEAVEVQELRPTLKVGSSQISFLPPETSPSDEPVMRLQGRGPSDGGVSSLDVYRIFRDFDLHNSTSTGIWKCLEAKLGREVKKSSVNAAIHRLAQYGFIKVTTPDKQRYRSYKLSGVGLTDEHFVSMFSGALHSARQPAE